MATFFNERAALQMNLENLLKMRKDLRTIFSEQDKALSIEIKELIQRVSELDQLGVEEPVHTSNEEVRMSERSPQYKDEVPGAVLPVSKRRPYTTIDYPMIKRCLEEILTGSNGPVSLKEVVTIMKRDNIYLSNYYITLQKVTKDAENIESLKQGREVFLVWKGV